RDGASVDEKPHMTSLWGTLMRVPDRFEHHLRYPREGYLDPRLVDDRDPLALRPLDQVVLKHADPVEVLEIAVGSARRLRSADLEMGPVLALVPRGQHDPDVDRLPAELGIRDVGQQVDP